MICNSADCDGKSPVVFDVRPVTAVAHTAICSLRKSAFLLDNERTMNRSILFSTIAVALVAAPLAATLAHQALAADEKRPSAATGEKKGEGSRRLSPEECKKLREQVRIASEESVASDGGIAAPLVPASAPATGEKAP